MQNYCCHEASGEDVFKYAAFSAMEAAIQHAKYLHGKYLDSFRNIDDYDDFRIRVHLDNDEAAAEDTWQLHIVVVERSIKYDFYAKHA